MNLEKFCSMFKTKKNSCWTSTASGMSWPCRGARAIHSIKVFFGVGPILEMSYSVFDPKSDAKEFKSVRFMKHADEEFVYISYTNKLNTENVTFNYKISLGEFYLLHNLLDVSFLLVKNLVLGALCYRMARYSLEKARRGRSK
jgi:hypothetical protein